MSTRFSKLAVGFQIVLLLVGCQKVSVREPVTPPSQVPSDTLAVIEPGAAESTAVVAPSPSEMPAAAWSARVGVIAPFSGRYASYGRAYLDGVNLAVEAFNAAGPARVEVVPADTKGTPIGALGAVRRLAESEEVACLLGGILNTSTWVAAVETQWHALPLVSNVASEKGIGEVGAWVFHEPPSQRNAARAAADLAVFELRRFRAAVLYPNEGEGRNLASVFSSRLGELGGRIVASEPYVPGTTDFNAAVRRIGAADPEILYLPVEPETMLLVAPTLAFQGIEAQIIGTRAWNSERLLGTAGLDLEGAILPAAEEAGDPEEVARFASAFERRFGAAPNRFAAAGYRAARRVLGALAVAPTPERESLRVLLATRQEADAVRERAFRFRVVRDGEAHDFDLP
ncbi:MAG: ABC transporter substrate-binding protein [Candidatus Latescibacterota bacterium]|nr:MAG: ABC transporter substrate-binding protein [Candidatus Latescibacterota bacterium]